MNAPQLVFFLSDFGELEHLLGRLSTPKNCKLENGLRHFLRFALSYGSECGSWDMQTCATNYRPDQVDLWCCSSWCYVDKEMTSNPSPKKGDGMEGTNVTRQSCEIWKARFKAPSFALPSRAGVTQPVQGVPFGHRLLERWNGGDPLLV